MSHIVESCPLTILNGGLSRLHSADEDVVSWPTNYGKWHAYEKKKINLCPTFEYTNTTAPNNGKAKRYKKGCGHCYQWKLIRWICLQCNQNHDYDDDKTRVGKKLKKVKKEWRGYGIVVFNVPLDIL